MRQVSTQARRHCKAEQEKTSEEAVSGEIIRNEVDDDRQSLDEGRTSSEIGGSIESANENRFCAETENRLMISRA